MRVPALAALLVLALVGAGFSPAVAEPAAPRPNVLIVLVDQEAPFEVRNLAGAGEHVARRDELRRRLDAFLESTKSK